MFKGAHVGMPGVYISTAHTLSIHPSRDVPVHLDGEIKDIKFPITIESFPRSFGVYRLTGKKNLYFIGGITC